MDDAKERNERLASDLHYIADTLQFAAEVLQMPSCHDCADVRECQVAPGWGKPVRYNCPLWRGKGDKK